jgi:hypothetical protein
MITRRSKWCPSLLDPVALLLKYARIQMGYYGDREGSEEKEATHPFNASAVVTKQERVKLLTGVEHY